MTLSPAPTVSTTFTSLAESSICWFLKMMMAGPSDSLVRRTNFSFISQVLITSVASWSE